MVPLKKKNQIIISHVRLKKDRLQVPVESVLTIWMVELWKVNETALKYLNKKAAIKNREL